MNRSGHPPKCFEFLSELLLGATEQASSTAATLSSQDLGKLWALANSHHVLMRSLPTFERLMEEKGNTRWAEWAANAAEKERARINHATLCLEPIGRAWEQCGDVIVIKSFDRWPDLGNDLDLFLDAHAADVAAVMRTNFKAQVAKRGVGDRLANKWNFIVPELPELLEIHVERLGQTGEQIAITESLSARARVTQLGLCRLRVPAAEDRVTISTLQRMYRHFCIRLCDIVDNAHLLVAARRLCLSAFVGATGGPMGRSSNLSCDCVGLREAIPRRRHYVTVLASVGSAVWRRSSWFQTKLATNPDCSILDTPLRCGMEAFVPEWSNLQHIAIEPVTRFGFGGSVAAEAYRK
jgi:hypothetical protein